MRISRTAVLVGVTLAACLSARAATLQLMVQSDFALFAGTGAGVTRLVYQNNADWPNHVASASSFEFDLLPGETDLYLAALGGGSVGGYLNNYNLFGGITAASSDISTFLTGYSSSAAEIQNGTYAVTLAEIQEAMSNITFSADANWLVLSDSDDSPDGRTFDYPGGSAILYRIDPTRIGMTVTPEPSSFALSALGVLLGLCTRRRH